MEFIAQNGAHLHDNECQSCLFDLAWSMLLLILHQNLPQKLTVRLSSELESQPGYREETPLIHGVVLVKDLCWVNLTISVKFYKVGMQHVDKVLETDSWISLAQLCDGFDDLLSHIDDLTSRFLLVDQHVSPDGTVFFIHIMLRIFWACRHILDLFRERSPIALTASQNDLLNAVRMQTRKVMRMDFLFIFGQIFLDLVPGILESS